MAVLEVTDASFGDLIQSDNIVVLDFWASWCGPCKSFAPIFEAAADKYPAIAFGKIDVDANQELAAHFQIRSVPTLMVLREKVMLFSQPGALSAGQLDELLTQVSELDMAEVHRQIAEQEASAS